MTVDPLHFAMATIWCMNASHAKRPVIVAVLARNKDGEWWPRADNLGEHMTVIEWDAPAPAMTGGIYRSYPGMRSAMGEDVRRHFETDPCAECGDKLSCRGERIDPVLDDFYLRGLDGGVVQGSAAQGRVLPVPLGALAARLGSR